MNERKVAPSLYKGYKGRKTLLIIKKYNIMKNKTLLLASVLAVTGVVALTAASNAFAYQGDYTKKGPNYTVERHETMEKAFANNDYATWKTTMAGRGRVSQVVNQDNFAKFAEAHKLAEQGKYTEANTIRTALGLGVNNGSGADCGRGMGRGQNGR
jgi:hypothetical protein